MAIVQIFPPRRRAARAFALLIGGLLSCLLWAGIGFGVAEVLRAAGVHR